MQRLAHYGVDAFRTLGSLGETQGVYRTLGKCFASAECILHAAPYRINDRREH
jgi:hypothetical protein